MERELLLNQLKAYETEGVLPMHMPGHKRNLERFPWLKELGGGLDITEIHGFDDVEETECFPGVRSFISVNGSTGGILAAVRAAVHPGDALLMARNCHKAVYHAAEICGAKVRYLLPDWDAEWGIYSRVQPETVQAALETAAKAGEPSPAAVIITSPTYEGDVSDIRRIAKICHARQIPLIVDEAHGAHFSLPGFPKSAIECGADIVIQSLHKTLPSPTQTAIVHCRGGLVSPEELLRQLLMFQTSSPSFLLMAAAEKCLDYVKKQGSEEATDWLRRIGNVKKAVETLQNIKLRQTDDPSKLLIGTGLSGVQWMDRLREGYGIEAEMQEHHAVLFMTGMGDTDEGMERLIRALRAENGQLPPLQAACVKASVLPEKVWEASAAVTLPKAQCPVQEAEGRISGAYCWDYPPGIPWLVPGERIGAPAVQRAREKGMEAFSVLDTCISEPYPI